MGDFRNYENLNRKGQQDSRQSKLVGYVEKSVQQQTLNMNLGSLNTAIHVKRSTQLQKQNKEPLKFVRFKPKLPGLESREPYCLDPEPGSETFFRLGA